MIRIFLLSLATWLYGCTGDTISATGTASTDGGYQGAPPDHSAWTQLLQKHVNEAGMVNYRGFIADSSALNKYLNTLSNHPPADSWSANEKLAYWINAYNAFTVQLIIRHYPVKSIKDIGGNIPFVNSPWDIKFIHIGGETYDLNNLEHGIIREEFEEPRIHFALVCAAVSCPPLRREAYVGARLDAQLNDQATRFLNNPNKNAITGSKAELSSILNWYGGDFKDAAPNMKAYVNRYSKTKIGPETAITYMDYNWALNEQQ